MTDCTWVNGGAGPAPAAEELCGRIGIIDRGRLVIVGTLDDLRARAGSNDGSSPSLETVFLDILHAGGDGRA